MDVVINTITSPGSCGHVEINVTVGGSSRTYKVLRSEVLADPASYEDAFLAVVRHVCKTEGYNTALQIKNGLEGRTVKL